MTHSYRFAIIRFAPDPIRGESLNIGVISVNRAAVDIRLTRRLDRVRALSNAVDLNSIADIVNNVAKIDSENVKDGISDPDARLALLPFGGPLTLSQFGNFIAECEAVYEERLSSILRMFVEPEPARVKTKAKRTKLFSQIRNVFKTANILARKDEGLESHRIVLGLELADGLVADMVLRNGQYNIIETVDATDGERSTRRIVSDIAISALVLERARMQFSDLHTKSRLVYVASAQVETLARPSLDAAQHQGAELVNWASDLDRRNFLGEISSIATPIVGNRVFVRSSTGGIFH